MADDPREVTINDQQLTCHHCANRTFHMKVAIVESPTSSFIGLGEAFPAARCYICAACTFIHWFADGR